MIGRAAAAAAFEKAMPRPARRGAAHRAASRRASPVMPAAQPSVNHMTSAMVRAARRRGARPSTRCAAGRGRAAPGRRRHRRRSRRRCSAGRGCSTSASARTPDGSATRRGCRVEAAVEQAHDAPSGTVTFSKSGRMASRRCSARRKASDAISVPVFADRRRTRPYAAVRLHLGLRRRRAPPATRGGSHHDGHRDCGRLRRQRRDRRLQARDGAAPRRAEARL